MATVALGIAAAAAGKAGGLSLVASGVLTAVSTAAGAYIDQRFLYPAIFGKPEDAHGPRLDDTGIQTASEGSSMRRVHSSFVRTAGTVVWFGDLEEVPEREESGGKGGGSGANVTTYNYFKSGAVGLCEGPIDSVRKIWAEGKILYDADTGSFNNSTVVSLQNFDVQTWNPNTQSFYISLYQARITSLTVTGPGPDLNQLTAGANCTIAGFLNANNNGTAWVQSTGYYGNGDSFMWITKGPPSTVTEAAGRTITITQSLPFYNASAARGITIYTGDQLQNPDPTIEAAEGIGNVPNWRGRAYVVFDGLTLAKFGNRWPTMAFLIRERTPEATVGDVIERVLARGGTPASDYDASACTAVCRGYLEPGPQSRLDSIIPLMASYGLTSQNRDGVLTFIPRTDVDELTIPAADLEASTLLGTPKRPFEMSREYDAQLPRMVRVRYSDPSQDWQRGMEPYRVPDATLDASEVDVHLEVTLTKDEALAIARRTAFTRIANNPVRFSLPPSYFFLRQSDRVVLPGMGRDWSIFLMRVTQGQNWVIECEGIVEQAQTLELQP